MGRFDNIDLGNDRTMRVMTQKIVRDRRGTMQDVIDRIRIKHPAAAEEICKMIEEEMKEVGL